MVARGLSAVVFMMNASFPMHSLMHAYRVRLLLTGILFAAAVAFFRKPMVAAGGRSLFCAKRFHTDRCRCHLADCHFAGHRPSADDAFRKEDLP